MVPIQKESSPPASTDRLSGLPDAVAGHVLSFLPTKQAARAAVLARRWRHVFCNVDAISFEERQGERANDRETDYCEAKERKSCSGVLLDNISSALLCRRRCAGGIHVPLRSFHFGFDSYHWWDGVHVDQWLTCVLRHSSQELHLDLRFRLDLICHNRDPCYYYDDDDDGKKEDVDGASRYDGEPWHARWVYLLPRRLFTCTALRTLCISNCRLKLPDAIDLPLIESLRVTSIRYTSERSIQRLISSCPRLVDLTLEAIYCLESVSVNDKRLRRFSLRCCHRVKNVAIDASELRRLDYCGEVPAESSSLLSWQHSLPPPISSCTVDFCKAPSKKKGADQLVRLTRFLEKISQSNHLHLHHGQLESRFFASAFPSFPSLTRLVLQGCIKSHSTVDAVRRILDQTPNLEVLSLYMEIEDASHEQRRRHEHHHSMAAVDEPAVVLDESSFSITCLRDRVKEINMVHYQGDEPQRMMARMLLRNALVLERMCVVLKKGPFEVQAGLKKEIESWLAVEAEKIFL